MIGPYIESINVGTIEKLVIGSREIDTAVRKRPTLEEVEVSWTGIVGDSIGDKEHHGGFNRALHCFSTEHYRYFGGLISGDIPDKPWVGENLTFGNYTDSIARIGDKLRIGSCVVEVSMPTERCAIPGTSVGLPKLTKWMISSLRTGFYMRVMEPGKMRYGDSVKMLHRGHIDGTISLLSTVMYSGGYKDVSKVNRALGMPQLANEWKESIWKKHEKCSRKD